MTEALFPQALSKGASPEEVSVHTDLANWSYNAYEAELHQPVTRERESLLENERNSVQGTMRTLAKRAIEARELV